MSLPVPKIEIAFSTGPDDPSPNWVDITKYVRAIDGLQVDHGRHDEFEPVSEDTLQLALINSDGRFTPGNTLSPYYPNVKKGRLCRVSVKDNGVTYQRFTGYVNEWPVTWVDASATVADIRSSRFASSRVARLTHIAVMRSVVENEILFDGPEAYYPLGEPEESVAAGNVSTVVQPQMQTTAVGAGSSLNIAFGTGTGPGTDSLTAPIFVRASPTSGAYLYAESSVSFSPAMTNGTRILECFFLANTAQEMGLCAVDGGVNRWYNDTLALGINASGKLTARLINGATIKYTITSSATVTDGQTHHGAIREFADNTGVTVDLVLDGVSVGSTFLSGATGDDSFGIIGGGNGVFASCFAGTLSHVAITWSPNNIPISRINQHYLAGHTGFAGEGSGARLTRLATYAGVPSASTDFDTGVSLNLDKQDTTGKTPLELMQDVEETEGGILFDDTNGILTFHDRSHRYNAPVVFTLLGSQLQSSLEPTLDDQFLANDVSASRLNGVTSRFVDTASVADYGTYRVDLQLITALDTEVDAAASWRLYLYSQPQVRVPVVELELNGATPAQKAIVLGAHISDRITLQGLPKQAPASSMDFFIEGWTEIITGDSHRISFYLSNALVATVWQLDSSAYSVLGSTTRLAY